MVLRICSHLRHWSFDAICENNSCKYLGLGKEVLGNLTFIVIFPLLIPCETMHELVIHDSYFRFMIKLEKVRKTSEWNRKLQSQYFLVMHFLIVCFSFILTSQIKIVFFFHFWLTPYIKQVKYNWTSANRWCLSAYRKSVSFLTSFIRYYTFNPLRANPIKWSNNLPTSCLSVLGHFVGFALKGSINLQFDWPRALTSTYPSKIGKLLTILMKIFIYVKNQGNPSNSLWDIFLLRILQFDWLSRYTWP